MPHPLRLVAPLAVVSMIASTLAAADLPAPPEAGAVWDLADAARSASPTRERVCLNGLWAFIPAGAEAAPPAAGAGWGWAKVPGHWPEGPAQRDWMWAGAAQDLLLPEGTKLPADGLQRAWYRRTVEVPAAWAGRTLVLDCALINTGARVRWAGAEAGALRWPGGRVALGPARPGVHALELLVDAGGALETLDAGLYTGARGKRQARLRGPGGDLHLEALPAARVADLRAEPSGRRNRLGLALRAEGAPAGARAAARVLGPDGALLLELPAQALADGAVRWEADAARLPRWDVHTPGNRLRAEADLLDGEGRLLDRSLPLEFGFRELWAEGRELVLNGIPFHGRVIQVANHLLPADRGSPAACERTLRTAKEWGFNAVWPIREFEPGEWNALDSLLEAADRVGMVVSLPAPPAKLLDWSKPEAALGEWSRIAGALAERAQRHPSAALWGMSFNYGWYYGHEDPRFMDGSWLPEPGAENVANGHRRTMALTEEALRRIDPTRWIYHHHSGTFAAAHTDCIYLNWAPIQERSEWPLAWSQRGTRPLMFVEWGLPHFASWSNYRGPAHLHGYMGPQWLLSAEYNAPYLGQEAYRPLPGRERLLKDNQDLLARGKPFHNAALIQSGWGFDLAVRKPAENGWIYREELPVQAQYAAENWRAFRAFGLSWILPWDQQGFARPAADAPLGIEPAPGRWTGLKRPGSSPDRIVHRYPTGADVFHAHDEERWAPSVLGREVLRWNRPLAAWIGGGPGADEVAARHRTWRAGETARHQLVVVNDRREARTVAWRWALEGTALAGAGEVVVPPGGQQRVPLALALPDGLAPGRHRLRAAFTAAGEEPQEDERELVVLPAPPAAQAPAGAVALWDPAGDSAAALRAAGVAFTPVDDPARLGAARLLVIGRGALRADAAVPGMDRLAGGLNLLVLEQGEEALRERFGLRTLVRGERRLHLRAGAHPGLAGIDEGWLADWRGSATLVPPTRPALAQGQPYDLKVDWNGFANAHVPRNGNRGSVASVLFEKPVRADVLTLVDGGFDLQYAALAEWRQGAGRALLCQLDVSGRSEAEPAAALVLNRLVAWLAAAPPPPANRPVRAAGAPAAALCARLGVAASAGGIPAPGELLVAGPGHGLGDLLPAVEAGAHVLLVGCGKDDLAAAGGALRWEAGPTRARFRADWGDALLAGCSNAELHLRTWIDGGLAAEGGRDTLAVLRRGAGALVAFQAAPWLLADPARPDLRTSERRSLALCARLLANLGAAFDPALAQRAADGRLGRVDLDRGWRARLDPGAAYRQGDWSAPGFDERAWPAIRVGEAYNGQLAGTEDHTGTVWYRLRFTLPAGFAADRPSALRLGPVDDFCTVWLDGVKLGEVSKESNPKDHWSVVKDWPLPAGLLRPGAEQVLAVQVANTYRTGGIMAAPRLLVERPSPYAQDLRAEDDPYRYFNW